MGCSTTNSSVMPIGPTGPVGNGALPIQDEGTQIVAAPTFINFVGAGVTATASGTGALVTIPGAASSGGIILYNSMSESSTGNAIMTLLKSFSVNANTLITNGDFLETVFILDTDNNADPLLFEFLINGTVVQAKVPTFQFKETIEAKLLVNINRISDTTLFLEFIYTTSIPSAGTYRNQPSMSVNFFESPITVLSLIANPLVLSLNGSNPVPTNSCLARCQQMKVTYFKKP